MMEVMQVFTTSAQPFRNSFLSAHFWVRLATLLTTLSQCFSTWGFGPNQTPSGEALGQGVELLAQ